MHIYLITGASGYIGSMLVKYLLEHDRDSRIVAPVRNIRKAEKRLKEIGVLEKSETVCRRNRLRLFQADLCACDFPEHFLEETDHIHEIIHCASVTDSHRMLLYPAEVIQSIVNGTQNVLELARRLEIGSMVYLSSMEVYGNMDCSDGHRAAEEEAGAGRVEILSARSCYPLGKRMAENLCYS